MRPFGAESRRLSGKVVARPGYAGGFRPPHPFDYPWTVAGLWCFHTSRWTECAGRARSPDFDHAAAGLGARPSPAAGPAHHLALGPSSCSPSGVRVASPRLTPKPPKKCGPESGHDAAPGERGWSRERGGRWCDWCRSWSEECTISAGRRGLPTSGAGNHGFENLRRPSPPPPGWSAFSPPALSTIGSDKP